MKGIQFRIYRLRDTFISNVGKVPNLLIVTPNDEMALNSVGIKVNGSILGMRIIVSDSIEETVAGLVET